VKRERKRPIKGAITHNILSIKSDMISSVREDIKSEELLKEISEYYSCYEFGQEVLKEALISLIKKNKLNNGNVSDCMKLIYRLSLSYIIDVVNMLNDKTIMLETLLNKYLEDKELYAYEEDYMLS